MYKNTKFKRGDSVMMHNCPEADMPEYKGKVWKCLTHSYRLNADTEMVFLEEYEAAISVEFLKKVDNPSN